MAFNIIVANYKIIYPNKPFQRIVCDDDDVFLACGYWGNSINYQVMSKTKTTTAIRMYDYDDGVNPRLSYEGIWSINTIVNGVRFSGITKSSSYPSNTLEITQDIKDNSYISNDLYAIQVYFSGHYPITNPTFDLSTYTLGLNNPLCTFLWSNLQNAVEGVNYFMLFETKFPTASADKFKVFSTASWDSGSFNVDFLDLVATIENYGTPTPESGVMCRLSLFHWSDLTVERIIDDYKNVTIYNNGNIVSEDSDNHMNESVTNDDNYNEESSVWLTPHRPTTEANLDNLLTTSYKITTANLRALATKLWGGGFGDTLEKLQNNPLENIVAIKTLPFNISSGSDVQIKIGNVNTEINGCIVTDNHKTTKITATVPKLSNVPDFLNYSPYSGVSIYLPFIGIRDLDVNMVMGKQIGVEYVYDIVTASCCAIVYVENTPINYFEGYCGVDLPLSAVNRSQVELQQGRAEVSGIMSAVGGAVSVLSGNVVGGVMSAISGGVNAYTDYAKAQYHTTTKGTIGSQLINFIPNECYLIIERPRYKEPDTYAHDFGYPCELSCTLGNLHGFTSVSHTVELDGIPCTQEEREELRRLLIGGVYL